MTPAEQESHAKESIRHGLAFGWTAESTLTDCATEALVLEGVDERTARNNVRRAWVEHFAIAGAV